MRVRIHWRLFALTVVFALLSKAAVVRANEEPNADASHSVRTVRNQRLAEKVHGVLDDYYRRPLSARSDTPWSMLHWSIAYGIDAQIVAPQFRDQPVTAIGWLCYNRPAAGQRLMSHNGESLQLPIAPGLQGHHGQFLSMLAQSGVSRNYGLRVSGRELTVDDLVEHERRTCRGGIELTFKLIGIAHYTPSDESWQNAWGQNWSVGRLLEEELSEPINRTQAPCGGLHRLMALSYAVERRRDESRPVDGPWQIAERRTREYRSRAFRLQNSDGSFSTQWLDGRGNSGDATRKLTTSGHILEWLAFSLPDDQLDDRDFERAVEYVANLLDRNRSAHWHRGALGHALHALVLYEQRVLDAKPGERRERLVAAN
jgi:hypothetical protein